MRKKIKIFLLLLLVGIIFIGWTFFPRLDLLTGYAAKNLCSCTFESGRDIASIEQQDNNFVPVSFATGKVDAINKTATASLFGIKPRKAVYEAGIGCTLLPENKERDSRIIGIPNRIKIKNTLPYPYGNGNPVDTVFQDIDYEKLQKEIGYAFQPENKTRAVLVLYKDHLLMEQYAPGFSKDVKLPGWSMTKSLTSSILGVLERQGKIDLEQDQLFPEWENDARSKVTLKHLLQMNSGLKWNEDYTKISDVTKMLFLEEDMGRLQIQKPLVGEPGNSWNYSSGTTNVLSRFIKDQFISHQEYLDFWYSAFIDHIGMNSMMIETDLAGNYVGSSYAWATARDWAKFGLLYLREGMWNDERILNKSWVEFSKTPVRSSEGEYGGHFWLNAGGKYPDVPKDVFSANGFQGQFVFIVPSHDLVVVRLGLLDDPDFDVNFFLRGIIGSVGEYEPQILAGTTVHDL